MPGNVVNKMMQSYYDYINERNKAEAKWLEEHGYKLIPLNEPSVELMHKTFIPNWECGADGRDWGWIIASNQFGVWLPEANYDDAIELLTKTGWVHHVGKTYDYWKPPKELAVSAHNECIRHHEARISNIIRED